jgi:hypothetical protein
MLEGCLKMLQNSIASSQELHLSFVRFDVSVLLWGTSARNQTDDWALFSTIGRSLFKSFSKTLDTMGKRLIGWQDVNSLGFRGFKTRMICETFHCAGKYPSSKTVLNKGVRYFIPIIGSSL